MLVILATAAACSAYFGRERFWTVFGRNHLRAGLQPQWQGGRFLVHRRYSQALLHDWRVAIVNESHGRLDQSALVAAIIKGKHTICHLPEDITYGN